MKLKGHTDNVKALLVNKDGTQVSTVKVPYQSHSLVLGPFILRAICNLMPCVFANELNFTFNCLWQQDKCDMR